ncbi:MAG TPA: serine hydrolase domain-containing protein [Pyrinomonadaceae bacterium]|nr:serine hydrolase domain-containing protein [Pyrinomonadaceae bacterium]
MKTTFSLVYLFVLAAVAASQTPAETRAREIAALISTGDRAAIRKYVEANFNDQMRRIPMERHLGFFSSEHDQSRGLDINGVQDSGPNEVTLLVKSRLTGDWQGLRVVVEATPPHKIAGIGRRPPKQPAGETRTLGDKDIARELDEFAKKLATADVFSGTILLARNGEVVYKGAFGVANKDFNAPNRIDTKFNLGSMNKMFTSVAIAQLVERGKMSFDDPLSKFIPDFPNAEAAKKIQIRHLLSHTAGLGGYFSDRYDAMSRERLRTVDDMMKLVREDEKNIQFEPGSKWAYSNTGMLVLGKVIEVVSGQSYYEYVRENIYKPAAMTNTDSYELDRVNPNLAVGYDKQITDAGVEWSNNVFSHVMRGGPQGGGYSTVEDLLKFDQALRSGKLISAQTLKVLTSPKPELNSPNYGYGFQVDTERNVAGHGGGFTGINSNLDMYLGSGWSAIVMSNYSRGAGPVQSKMRQLVANAK